MIERVPAAGAAPSRYSARVLYGGIARGVPLCVTQPRNTDCSLSHGVSCSDHVYPAFEIKKKKERREMHTRARKEEEASDARTDEPSREGGTGEIGEALSREGAGRRI